MRAVGIPIILLGYIITITTGETQDYHPADTNAVPFDSTADNDGEFFVKRSGIDRRAYTYNSGMSGIKRLPNYNFGLGKPYVNKPYSFGLGKRSDDDYAEYADDKPTLTYDQIKMILPFISGRQIIDDDDFSVEKRARPYSFGLGKRFALPEQKMERRSMPTRYNFGLGR